MDIHIDSMRYQYLEITNAILDQGERVSPRGQDTKELIASTIILSNPLDSLPIGIGRKINTGIAAFEALQLIGGFSDPEMMIRISPQMKAYTDDGVFYGAYGNRIGTQLDDVAWKLIGDRDSRQALITLWDPQRDNLPGRHDYPCTVSLHFMIRKDKLILHTHMRSNDAWLGLTYDMFQFTQLQLTLARILHIEVGPYFHHTTSLHIYERDIPKIDALATDPVVIKDLFIMPDGIAAGSTSAVRRRTRMIHEGTLDDPSAGETWYLDQIKRGRA